ncbi:catalase [Chryseobacterium sp. T16E-39]|uniref:catalase n=1 Tax=Chryseobacterium sp. T16E-39 TaxID=2015076 RepID=UPI000B5B3DCE|nr:catalase [Chryseobacterium sp. T16E-39]ASK31968.1 catalase [Chryseobacterium sp. T16E-39]
MPSTIRYNKKFDQLTDEEKALFEINKKSIADFVEQSSSVSDVNYATRNAHAKTYAVAHGEFKINPGIPEELQQFFDKDKYDLMIRFSNAHPQVGKNRKEIPAYGFAVKIKDENGDLLANYPMVNFPLFPINSVSTFLQLFTAVNRFFVKKWNNVFSLTAQVIKAAPYFFTPSMIKNVFRFIGKRNDFLLAFDYYSVGAYRMGEYVMKIKLQPQSVKKNFGRKMSMQKALESYFESNDYTADVMIQLCYDLNDQPINKLNQEWKNSPFIKVGEVKMMKGCLLDPRSCETELLSFNPFESKSIFHPVGKIQKLRDEAYKVSLQTRRKINKLLHG